MEEQKVNSIIETIKRRVDDGCKAWARSQRMTPEEIHSEVEKRFAKLSAAEINAVYDEAQQMKTDEEKRAVYERAGLMPKRRTEEEIRAEAHEAYKRIFFEVIAEVIGGALGREVKEEEIAEAIAEAVNE